MSAADRTGTLPPRTNPRFSVVIPLYNKGGEVTRAAKSVLGQSVGDLELIVVDDGSTDGGAEALSQLADKRLRVIRQLHSGVSAARNLGIASAKAEYVCFLDADDEWHPWFLSVIQALIDDYPNAAMYSVAHEIEESGKVSRQPTGLPREFRGYVDDFFGAFAHGSGLVHSSSVCVRKDALLQIGGFPTGKPVGEDLYVWCRLALSGKVAHDGRVCATYHQCPGSFTALRRWDNPRATELPYHLVYLASLLRGDTGRAYVHRTVRKYFHRSLEVFVLARVAYGGAGRGRELVRAFASDVGQFRAAALYSLTFLPPPLIRAARQVRRMALMARR